MSQTSTPPDAIPGFQSPLQKDDDVDYFHVKQCTDGRLVLGTKAGCMIAAALASFIWTLICFFILYGTWGMDSMGYFSTLISGKVFGGFLFGLIIFLGTLANIGRLLIFDGNATQVASKWFYFLGAYRPLADFAAITVHISQMPVNSEVKPPASGPPPLPTPPRWKLKIMLSAVEKGDMDIGSTLMHKDKEISRLLACLIYLYQILKLPVTFTGPIDQLPEGSWQLIRDLQAIVTK